MQKYFGKNYFQFSINFKFDFQKKSLPNQAIPIMSIPYHEPSLSRVFPIMSIPYHEPSLSWVFASEFFPLHFDSSCKQERIQGHSEISLTKTI